MFDQLQKKIKFPHLQCDVNVLLLLAADGVAADLAILATRQQFGDDQLRSLTFPFRTITKNNQHKKICLTRTTWTELSPII